MSAFREIVRTPAGVFLCIAALLLLFWQIDLLARGIRMRRGIGSVILSVCHLLFDLILLVLLLDGIYTLGYLPYERAYLPAVRWVSDLPWIAIAASEAASAALSAFYLLVILRAMRKRPSAYDIKKTLDFLPIGICVGEQSGRVLLGNLKMNEIAKKLTGGVPSDLSSLIRAFESAGEDQGGRRLVHPDDCAYVFEQSDLTLNGSRYICLIAEDQSEQYRAVRQLEEKNARLRDLQYRLKAYQVREEDLMISQEILAARSVIHTQLGGALLTGKYYLEHPEKVDERELHMLMWQINTYLLAEVEEPEDRRDEYASAMKMAQRIGVKVICGSPIPKTEPMYSLVGQAISETAANTVKHACGDEVRVTVEERGGECVVTLENNGKAPNGEIIETGGLLSLRRAAENAGIEMTVKSLPAFRLTLKQKKD